MQIGNLYREFRDRLRAADIPTADLDARILMSEALAFSQTDLILKAEAEVSDKSADLCRQYLRRRLAGEPVGRILGQREFYGRAFALNEATLEPRPDTELLIDTVLNRTPIGQSSNILDIGTGTGAIAITLLAERDHFRAVATDISERALSSAAGNAAHHGVSDRIEFVCADYASCFNAKFDWVVSNPPYIRTSVLPSLSTEVNQFDPLLALDGGDDGLTAYRNLTKAASFLLVASGYVAFEIGYDQADEVKKMLIYQNFIEVEVLQDLGGNDRIVVAKKL